MKIKKPSLKGMKNCGYLGHFSQDKYLEKGHNFSGKIDPIDPMSGALEKEIESAHKDDLANAPMAFEQVFEKARKRRMAEEDRAENLKKLEKYREGERRYGPMAAAREGIRLAIKKKMRGK